MSNNPLDEMMGNIKKEMNKGMGKVLNGMMKDFMKKYGKLMPNIQSGLSSQIDPYQILALKPEASNDEVNERYKYLMNVLHPDKVGESTNFLAALVNIAYSQVCLQRGIK